MIIMSRFCMFIVLFSSSPLAPSLGRADREPVSMRLQCGDIENVTSPNYPQHYVDDVMSRWKVEVDAGQRIIVTFNDFHTENSDYLYIREKNYPSAEAKYSGNIEITPYVSIGNHLMITFRPDLSQSKVGFHLSISCWKEIKNDTVHTEFEGDEHTRILTQPICEDDWNTNVADTICREAGFPGSYDTNFTSGIENVAGSDGIVYRCNKSTYRLQDCERSTSKCNVTQESLVIKCNVFSALGCFDLAQYTHLLTASVQLSRDQCVAHCNAYYATPQYAVHQHGTRCSCINQTDLDVNILLQERDRCTTNVDSKTWTWATLFNASFGFCEKPPRLNNGSWQTTSDGYMYGSTITAVCNDELGLVDGDQMLKCGKGVKPSSHDFEWHGTISSCRERNNVVNSTFELKMASTSKVFKSTFEIEIASTPEDPSYSQECVAHTTLSLVFMGTTGGLAVLLLLITTCWTVSRIRRRLSTQHGAQKEVTHTYLDMTRSIRRDGNLNQEPSLAATLSQPLPGTQPELDGTKMKPPSVYYENIPPNKLEVHYESATDAVPSDEPECHYESAADNVPSDHPDTKRATASDDDDLGDMAQDEFGYVLPNTRLSLRVPSSVSSSQARQSVDPIQPSLTYGYQMVM